MLAKLTDVEREIIHPGFGFEGNGPQTLQVIGARRGVSRERIRQIEAKPLRKMLAWAKDRCHERSPLAA